MTKKWNVAVVGATGMVGQSLLEILASSKFPIDNIHLLASARSAGEMEYFDKKLHPVSDLAEFDFSKADIAFFAAGGSVSAKYVPIAAKAKCVSIDNTSEFRYDDEVPLVVPEVNSGKIADYKNKWVIANPNCSTIQMMVALKPIYDAVGIERINVSTYQAVSGSGRLATQELAKQGGELLNGKPPTVEAYPLQIAFNVLPHIDTFQENGYTREEMKMVWETRKILGDDSIQVNPTAVRVPVFCGHSEAINIETREKLTASQATELLKKARGVSVHSKSQDKGYPTPITHLHPDKAKRDLVHVGRIREDISHDKGLNLWVVADNVRKGAALNAVQIAEILIKQLES